jgi:hypothetical protein
MGGFATLRAASRPPADRSSVAETSLIDRAPVDAALHDEPRGQGTANSRRFKRWALSAIAVAAAPYLWVLFWYWNETPNLFRTEYQNGYGGNFYDLQARAILSGHLYVPNGSLNIETWTHNGHQYTYFGVFPSLLRIPVLLVTHSLDGKLTACSLLLAWIVTAWFTSVSVWRIRVLMRGRAMLGRTEAAALGVLVGTVLAGSVLVYLAANPYVYSEDKAWSVALSLGAFFALLGVLERPSGKRVALCAVLILAANLTRLTEGYACVIGAVLVACWLGLGRKGEENRRWWIPIAGIAAVSVIVGSAINWAKSGSLFGLPVSEYTAFHVLHESAINGGHYFSVLYFPSALYAYLQPGGIRLTSLFPFLTLPGGPTRVIGDVMFDSRTRTASVVASMPLLFILSCTGVVAVFRRRTASVAPMLRIILFSAASGTAAVLFYGWIADRFLADFLPFLILAAGVGLVFLWWVLEDRSRKSRLLALSVFAVLAIFSVAANIGLSITPSDSWTEAQASHFLEFQKAISDATGHPLNGQVHQGNTLPYWAPADTVFIAGNCDALYVSNGQDYSGVLNQRAEHWTWVPVERDGQLQHLLRITFDSPSVTSGEQVLVATMGTGRLWLHAKAGSGGLIAVWFSLQDPLYGATSLVDFVPSGSTHTLLLTTDPFADVLDVSFDGVTVLESPVAKSAPPVLNASRTPKVGSVLFAVGGQGSAMALCKELEPGR